MTLKLDAYIAKTILLAIGFVTLMLIGLQVFVLFVSQLDELGRGDYDALQAIAFVLLKTPNEVYLFFPMASLLGCLIGLGILANNRELIVMQAAGKSIGQITLAVLKASVIVVVLVTLLGETLVPYLSNYANDLKMQAISEGRALRTEQGVWLREGNDFINIGQVQTSHVLHHVNQFRFDEKHRLNLARKIGLIRYQNGSWQAEDVAETVFDGQNTKALHYEKMTWDVPLNASVLHVGGREPDEMTLLNLHQYLQIQKKNHQNIRNHQLLYWQRLFQPFSTIVMMILAIPFIFGPLRTTTIGSKLLVGAAVGFSFHIINRVFDPITQVYQWPPEIAAFGPTLLFAMFGLYLMKRTR